MSRIFDIVRTIRRFRADSNIKPGDLRDVHITPPKAYTEEIEANTNLITGLSKVATLTIGKKPQKTTHLAYGVIHGIDIYVDASIDEESIENEKTFVQRHVELADPDLIVLMGNTPAQAVLGARGITRLRGQWTQAWGKPVLPMLHPAYLLCNPIAKREAWADLLALKAKLAAARG